jgi:hypothetical protein
MASVSQIKENIEQDSLHYKAECLQEWQIMNTRTVDVDTRVVDIVMTTVTAEMHMSGCNSLHLFSGLLPKLKFSHGSLHSTYQII